MKKIVSLLVTLCFMMVMFCAPIYAQTTDTTGYKVETPQDAHKLIDGANKGDVDAINKLTGLKAFRKAEVAKAFNNIKLTAAERSKSIKFDDGSEIVLVLEMTKSATSDERELQYSVEWNEKYIIRLAGVEVARYTVYYDYYSDGSNCSGLSSYDGQDAIFPYTLTTLGTTNQITSGLYVKCYGRCTVAVYGGSSYTIKLTCYGYPDPSDNWSSGSII